MPKFSFLYKKKSRKTPPFPKPKTQKLKPKKSKPKKPKPIPKSKSLNALCYEDVIIGTDISYGTYGVVKRGIYIDDGYENDCVTKIVNFSSNYTEEDFVREAELMATVKHKNILGIFGYLLYKSCKFHNNIKKNQGHMILELCSEFNLSWVIENEELCNKDKLDYSIQIAEGIATLHSMDIIHRDIKPANILFGDDGYIKICDFGTSKKTFNIKNSIAGTPDYMDPTLVNLDNDDDVDHRKFDIYSYGILLWELWTQCVPYLEYKKSHGDNYNGIVFILHVNSTNRRPDVSELKKCPKKIRKLVLKCWDKDHSKRPNGFEEILKKLKKK